MSATITSTSDLPDVDVLPWDDFPDGEFWMTTEIVGLRYYEFGRWNPVRGTAIVPELGDRLNLMRRPDNPADTNAL